MQEDLMIVSIDKNSEVGMVRSYNYEELEKMSKENVEELASMLEAMALEIREI